MSSLLFSLQAQAQLPLTEKIDSLERALKQPANDLDLYYTYLHLLRHYNFIDSDKALEYAREGAMVAKEKDNLYWTADFYYSTGSLFHDQGKLDSALYYFDLSFELQKQAMEEGTEDKNENDYLTLYLLRDVGRIYAARGYFDMALEFHLKALSHSEQMNDSDELLSMYWHLADVYFRLSNYEQAESYFLKMKELASELNDPLRIAEANLGLIPILNMRGELTQALEYGEEAYHIMRQAQSQALPRILSAVTMRLSEIWLKIPDYDKAMEYALESVDYARQIGHSSNVTTALYTLSSAYLRKGLYAECEQAAFEALASDSSDIYTNSILYGNIAQAYIWMGNGKKGIEYFAKTLDAYRAFSNKNFQTSLSEMEVKYESEKKELQITGLKRERKLIVWSGLVGMAILLLILVLFFTFWRWAVQKKRAAEQLHQIAEQQVKQLEQEQQLIAIQAVLDGETAERTRLARDLHDGLGSMLTGVKLNLESIKNDISLNSEEEQKSLNNAVGMLKESMVELRRVAHHLMPDSLNRFGLKIALSDFCNNFPIIEFAYFGNDERFDPKLEAMIYRIIHELVNNAMKHANASHILVQVMKEDEYVAFIVRDNGCGFDVSAETKGMGLRNICDRVASYNGRIEIYSKPGAGTEINVELKIENFKIYGNK